MCNQCDAITINGVLCHEHGCPEAYKDETRECKWCGSKFTPEYKQQNTCSDECSNSYN